MKTINKNNNNFLSWKWKLQYFDIIRVTVCVNFTSNADIFKSIADNADIFKSIADKYNLYLFQVLIHFLIYLVYRSKKKTLHVHT